MEPRGTGPNARLSVLCSRASPATSRVPASGRTEATLLTRRREACLGSRTATTSPGLGHGCRTQGTLTTTNRSPGCNAGAIEVPDTTTRWTDRRTATEARASAAPATRRRAGADRLSPPQVAHAHCDLPCGVYDPAQARIEAESVKGTIEKFNASDDETFKIRATLIKEERAELVKHHLWVLWTDYFKPEHLEKFPQLHDLFWKATKTAGESKKANDVAVADRLLAQIAEIDAIFWETKK